MSLVIQILKLFPVDWPHTDIMSKGRVTFLSLPKQLTGNVDGNLLDLDFAADGFIATDSLYFDIESAKKGSHHSLGLWNYQKRLCGIQLDLPCVRLVRAGDSR
jgi:hypothetical protein